MKKRLVAIVCLIALMLSMSTLGSLSVFAEGEDGEENPWLEFYDLSDIPDYSFAVIGDIQSLTYLDTDAQVRAQVGLPEVRSTSYLSTLFDWIIENKDERKIEYVFGLGDSVETLSTFPNSSETTDPDYPYYSDIRNPIEWAYAGSQFARLDGVIPYSVVRGNHDDEAGYHQYICTDDYKNQMDGFFYDETKPALDGNSMSNSYRKIEFSGQKYLMMTLDFDTNEDVIAWANNVIAANPDYRVIVSLHAYLDKDKGTGKNYFLKEEIAQPGADSQEDNDTNHDWFDFDAEIFWTEIFSKHENMFMVLSGHVREVEDPIIRNRKGTKGNHVFEVLVNPQTYDRTHGTDVTDEETGVTTPGQAGGFVMILNFSHDGNKVEFEYISTVTGKHFKAKNQTVKTLPGTSMMTLKTTTTTTTPASSDENKGGCKGAVLSTAAVTSVIGTSLAAFAMRKRKENN